LFAKQLTKQQRDRAIELGQRRPWDGPHGADFLAYKRDILKQLREAGKIEAEQGEETSPEDAAASRMRQIAISAAVSAEGAEDMDLDEASDSDNSVVSDVSFQGYDDLTIVSPNKADEQEDEDAAGDIENLVVSDVSSSEDEADDNKQANDSDDSDL
jgi:hypothetical protein